MKKLLKNEQKQEFASVVGNAIEKVSGLFVKTPCFGTWYEPEVPAELQDK